MLATSFQGGGFRAHSAFTGILAALMSRMVDLNLVTAPSVETLFKDVEAVTSNSGGSWFVADLAYSAKFIKGLERCSRNRSSQKALMYFAKRFYTEVYVDPFVETVEKPNSDIQRQIQAMIKELSVSGLNDLAKAVNVWSYLFTFEETSWQTIVEGLVNATGISPSTTLGSTTANAWTEGKDWLVQSAVLTPSHADWTVGSSAYLYSDVTNTNYLKYSVSSNKTLGDSQSGGLQGYVPARFSTSWRQGGKAGPYPFCSVCTKLDLHYESNKFWPLSWETIHHGTTKTWQREMGSMLVKDVMSASSAAAAAAAIAPLGPLRAMLEPPKFAIFGVDSPGPKAFDVTKYRKKKTWSYVDSQEVAGKGLIGMADGGYVDNTAVAAAILTGASEVLAFTNNIMEGPGPLQALFSGAKEAAIKPESILLAYYPLFKEDVSQLTAQWKSLATLELPKGTSWLSGVNVGKVTVTVRDNEFWDVKGQTGRVVTLYIVNTITMIPDAPLSSDNSILVQELMDTLLAKENLKYVDEILSHLHH